MHRAVDAAHRELALAGSRAAGRYSRPEQPTLYLSGSAEGVEAAMRAHTDASSPDRALLRFRVRGARVLDLRDSAACRAAGIDRADAAAPWQEAAARGGTPRSWLVRDRVEALGADGLIDPSRAASGLWHLVLLRWNEPGAPSVEPA